MRSKPLYPHEPKRKEPLFPHVPKAKVTPVTPEVTKESALPEGVRGIAPEEVASTREEMGTLAGYTDDVSFRNFLGKDTKYWNEATYRKAKAGQSFKIYRAVPTDITEIHSGAWVTQSREYAQMHLETILRGKGHVIEGTAKASALIAMAENEFFYAPEAVIPKAEAEINQIVADLNLLREEKVWVDTFKTKGASIIHLQTGETATIIEPPQTIYPFASYEERAMHIKWADGSEMVVDSGDFAPSTLQKRIAEITHGKPIPEFPTARPRAQTTSKEPFVKVGERVRFIGSSRSRYETWPEGKWLEHGVTGTVTEYHPEHPAVRVRGEYFEAIPPYAVVRWDLGGATDTAIDPEDEGERWERIRL